MVEGKSTTISNNFRGSGLLHLFGENWAKK